MLSIKGAVLALMAVALGCISTAQETGGDEAGSERLLIIYDSSNSMWGELSDASRKYEAGRTALGDFLSSTAAGRDIGFRAYGHRRKDDCRDSELMVGFAPSETAATQIETAVAGIRPTGKTPITWSLQEGLKDLDGEPGDILLISDGIETCDADPCDLMRDWKSQGVNVRVHVVGIGLTEMERTGLVCIAEESGGTYFDADTELALEEALSNAGTAIEAASLAIVIDAVDADGNALRSKGTLYRGAELVSPLVSAGYGRNLVDTPGAFEIEIGALLQDGTIYRPVRMPVSVADAGETRIIVTVPRPASVSAEFSELGEEHRGALVHAYRDGDEAFSFRPGDTAFAAPGVYEFRSSPNAANALVVTADLTEAEHTTILFDLQETVDVRLVFVLPDGTQLSRNSELWQGGEKIADVHGANGAVVPPGVYEVRSDDDLLPLTPVEVELDASGEFELPLAAGFLTVSYVGDPADFVSVPGRAFLTPEASRSSIYVSPDERIAVAPRTYTLKGYDSAGFFEPVTVTVGEGESVSAEISATPLGQLVVEYDPAATYTTEPDRAWARGLDGQRVIGGIFKPGEARKLLPGRYRVSGWDYAGDFEDQEVEIRAGETATVVLTPVQ